ncbi:hypothetical protein KV557_08065 [Kitasatospora aureofaciens]|uniref:hypothetical protein n=1 Tax=Kitasatospora aureofaciens TaxID=1894 RepID=UPI001C48B1B6|nr:hypothetical protein [Kitasatospora aureofaciens]MBV6697075.1 hypothetical protein [Kitasatospora aureofaciens]
MPITDEIKKTLTDPTPLYALAGAGDLAYEKLREVPGRVEALAADRKGAQEKAGAKLQEAQAKLAEAQARVTDTVTMLPTDLKALQERAQDFALQQVGRAVELAVKAKETYDELAERGKVVVERTRPGSPDVPAEPELLEAEVVSDEMAEDEVVEADAEPVPKKNARARKGVDGGE